jgi:hypothetical protein
MDVSEKTLKTIEEEKITPQPRWHFLLKDYFIWVLFTASIIIGAMATSAILFMLTANDWDVYDYLDRTLFQYIFISLPYLWILVLAVFIIAAYYNFKYTRRGYHYEIYVIILGSVLISALLGLVLFFGGLGEGIHEIFAKQVPFYNDLVYDKKDVWNNPAKGLLGGQFINVENEQNGFLLRDFNGKIWQIKKGNSLCCDSSLIQTGKEVELIGRMEDENLFFVSSMRPWHHGYK